MARQGGPPGAADDGEPVDDELDDGYDDATAEPAWPDGPSSGPDDQYPQPLRPPLTRRPPRVAPRAAPGDELGPAPWPATRNSYPARSRSEARNSAGQAGEHWAEAPPASGPANTRYPQRNRGFQSYGSGWAGDSSAGTPRNWPQYGPGYPSPPSGQRGGGYNEPGAYPPRPPAPMWMILLFSGLLAAVVAILVILLFALIGGVDNRAAGSSSTSSSPAVTMAGARQVLTVYAAANNAANRSRSDKELATVEAGSSYALDTGQYRWLDVSDPGNQTYAPLSVQSPSYYIPLLPSSSYPRWFAVHVTYLVTGGAAKGARSTGYILFTQQEAGAAWKNTLEPYMVSGAGPAPDIVLDANGYASAVSPQAPGLAVAPGALPAATATALNGAGDVSVPGTLLDQQHAAFWRKTLPAGSSVSLAHTAVLGTAAYALRTADGGALVLFAAAAVLRIAPPRDKEFQIVVPGYFTSSETERSAALGYAEQYAVVDPPAGHGMPHAVADVSGIDARL